LQASHVRLPGADYEIEVMLAVVDRCRLGGLKAWPLLRIRCSGSSRGILRLACSPDCRSWRDAYQHRCRYCRKLPDCFHHLALSSGKWS
ncbi:MAG TPA: hypothetical protein VF866_04590, partial [Xanthobacteraceae bacterium]